MIVKKYYKLVRVSHEDSKYFYIKNISNEAGVFVTEPIGLSTFPELEYSLDGITWTTYDFTTLPEVTVAAGANIYFRGNNANGFSTGWNKYVSFHFSKTYKLGGNMMSLISKNNYESETTIPGYGFQMLFNRDGVKKETNLVSISDVSFGAVTNLKQLRYTFYNCENLTDFFDFSNFTEVHLESTFRKTGITVGPDLSNVTSGELPFAFGECVNLYNVTAPNIQNLGNVLTNWLNGSGTSVPAGTTKVVNVPTGATIATDSVSGIPTGWTRVDY